MEGSVGKQTESQKITAPIVAFPKQTRDKQNKVFLPSNLVSFGHDKITCNLKPMSQILLNLVLFTTGKIQVFLSREHDKSHYGEASPGPGSFGQTSSVVSISPTNCWSRHHRKNVQLAFFSFILCTTNSGCAYDVFIMTSTMMPYPTYRTFVCHAQCTMVGE